jgi:hypothetical protein
VEIKNKSRVLVGTPEEKLSVSGRIILKYIIKIQDNILKRYSGGPNLWKVNEPSGFIKRREFLHQLSYYQLLRKDSFSIEFAVHLHFRANYQFLKNV